MTKSTCSSKPKSVSGLPGTATISASLPDSRAFTSFCKCKSSAASLIADRMAAREDIPYSTILAEFSRGVVCPCESSCISSDSDFDFLGECAAEGRPVGSVHRTPQLAFGWRRDLRGVGDDIQRWH